MRKDMKKACFILLTSVVVFMVAVAGARATNLNGAGATFPYPVYSRWAYKYHRITGVALNYQSIGSGGGIAQIKARTVDFGASDAPMKPGELKKYGLVQFPMIMGGVVPVVNLRDIGPGKLKISENILANIFLGKITRWDDDALKKINPGIDLPNRGITVVHRADGSGTTWIFTNYLSKISDEWHKRAGFGKAVAWPVGVGGKGNEGVSAYVQRLSGSIGYVEFAYALQNKMSYVLLENSYGNFVAPTMKTFQSAATSADWKHTSGFYMVLTDQPGIDTWPIVGASFILIYKDQKDMSRTKTMLRFFDWCYRHGADIAEKLKYVPMPGSVVNLVEGTWKNEVRVNGEPVWP